VGTVAERRSPRPPDLLLGRTINDRFRIVALIARGGMGKVYRAEQSPLGRQVALKILDPHYSGDGDPEFQRRFFLEASTCSKLSHPNTVTIFDYGKTDDEIFYIAMELLEGRTLHRALRDGGPMQPDRAMHVARQVCRSLREAHGLGVIHRDLKPANVFLIEHGDEPDFAKVLDFGLVKDVRDTGEDLTQTGLFMGSPKYMSPEQIRGEKVDRRVDVYAFGVILFEMLTGTVPFDRPNSVNILMAHVHDPPPSIAETNPDVVVPEALEELVRKALAKEPADRFESMDAMLDALKQLAVESGFSISRSTELGTSGESSLLSGPFPAVPASVSVRGPATTSYSSFPPPAPLEPSPDEGADESGEGSGRSALPFVVAGVGVAALLAAAFIAFVARAPEPIAPPVTGPLPAEPAEAPPSDGPPSLPPPPDPAPTVTVALRSTPAGASVRVGDHLYGPTPIDVEWRGDDALEGRNVAFVFELAGHRELTVTRVLSDEPLEVDAELEAIRRAPRPAGAALRGRPRGRPTGPVEGYKLDPY
jgi:serine/threonine-protein kinase